MDIVRTAVTSVSQAPPRFIVAAVSGLILVISVTGMESEIALWIANMPAAHTVITYSKYLDRVLAMLSLSNFGSSIYKHQRLSFFLTLVALLFCAYVMHVQNIDENHPGLGHGVKMIYHAANLWLQVFVSAKIYFSEQFQKFSPTIKSMWSSLYLLLPFAADLRFVVQVQLGITAMIVVLFWIKKKWAFWSIVGLQVTLTLLILASEVHDDGFLGFVNVVVSVGISAAVYYMIDKFVGGKYSVAVKVLLRSAWNGMLAMEARKIPSDCVKIVVYSLVYFGCQFYILDKHLNKLDDKKVENEGEKTSKPQYAY